MTRPLEAEPARREERAEVGLPAPHPWWRRAVEGAVAGVVATAVQSATRLGAERAGLASKRSAHSEIGRLRALVRRKPSGHEDETTATIAHYAFGAGAGALYAVVAPRRGRPLCGVVYSMLMWATSYLKVLPWLRLVPPPSRDDTRRQVIVAVDHVVYGVVLDGTLALLQRR
jgi:hypothetical protein